MLRPREAENREKSPIRKEVSTVVGNPDQELLKTELTKYKDPNPRSVFSGYVPEAHVLQAVRRIN